VQAASPNDNTKEKKKEVRERKKQARLAAKQALSQPSQPKPPTVNKPKIEEEKGPIAVAMDQVAQPAPPSNKLKLDDELCEKIADLFSNAMEPITSSLALEIVPSPPEPKQPDAILAKYIGEKGPSAKSARRAELEATIKTLKATAATLQGGGESVAAILAGVQSQLEVDEAALAKLPKDAPSQDLERMAVTGARSAYETHAQARRDREARGAAKATERQDQRLSHIANLKQQLALLEAGLLTTVAENSAKHEKNAAAAAAVDEQVLALFDQKLAGIADVAMQPAPPGPSTSNAAPAAVALALEAAARVEVPAATLQELETLKQANARLMALVETSCIKIMECFEKRFEDIMPNHIAKPAITDPDQLVACGGLFNTLQNWAAMGARDPFEWNALAGATGTGVDVIQLCRQLLGDTWGRWYATEPPGLDSVVPCQVGLLIHYGLGLLQQEYVKEEAREKVAQMSREGHEAVRASSKRLRVAK